MTNGYRRGYGMPQSQSPWYSPYSKYPQWGAGIASFLNNLKMMKDWRESQDHKQWQRSMAEEQLELQKRRLEQPRGLSIQEQRWGMADAKVASGEWTPAQGETYKLKGEVPEPRVKYPATTATNVKKMFGITDEEWKELPTQQKGAYFKEFILRKRPKAGKEALTPEEEQVKITVEKQKNLFSAVGTRFKGIEKDLTALAKPQAADQYRTVPPHRIKAQQELKNVQQLSELVTKAITNAQASGRPLMPEYEKLVTRFLKAPKEDIKSGKFYSDILADLGKKLSPPQEKEVYRVGQRKTAKDGTIWEYIGNDKWRQIK